MSIIKYLKNPAALLKRFQYKIINTNYLYDWQKNSQPKRSYNSQTLLPPDATGYLHEKNTILTDLQSRYSAFNNQVTTPLAWKNNHLRPQDILYFRGDNAYVWQLRGQNMNIMSYTLTMYYVKSIDTLGLLNNLTEDEYFGNYTFNIGGKLVSRDLLDSIIEIYFLEEHLKISSINNLTVLDIGAGYGRLAHRMVSALPNIKHYLCTDAFPASTFISDYYLHFRNLTEKAQAIALDQIENTLQEKPVNIAINIHSFSECKLSAIEWWLSILSKNSVKYLMIVPNANDHGGQFLRTNDGDDFGKLIEEYGYKLIVKQPKYKDIEVQKYAINPTYHYLFELHN